MRDYEAILFDSGKSQSAVDTLTAEAPLQISINGTAFSITMRTPGDDEDLIRGLLHSEGIIKDASTKVTFVKEKTENELISSFNVLVQEDLLKAGFANSRSLMSVASCGICGKTELDEFCEDSLDSAVKIDPGDISGMFDQMNRDQYTFKNTGGSHAAAAFDKNNELLCIFEDIGRHNAVDKVIGNLIRKNTLNLAQTLTVSGRVSYEIVIKGFKAKIPVLASVSAPSTLAVDYAKELGITLFSYCRGERATCYANTQRVTKKSTNKAG